MPKIHAHIWDKTDETGEKDPIVDTDLSLTDFYDDHTQFSGSIRENEHLELRLFHEDLPEIIRQFLFESNAERFDKNELVANLRSVLDRY